MISSAPLKVIEDASLWMLQKGWSSEYVGWCVGPESGALEHVIRNPGISAQELAEWGMEKIRSRPPVLH